MYCYLLIDCTRRSSVFGKSLRRLVVSNAYFYNIGNDGIDLSGSEVSINNVQLFNLGDKGISIGERSKARINNISIQSAIMGLASKDGSQLLGDNIEIKNSKIGLAGYIKKSEYGPSIISLENINIENTNDPFLVENNSKIIINGKRLESNIEQVYDSIYSK